jgi:hypothetical protein
MKTASYPTTPSCGVSTKDHNAALSPHHRLFSHNTTLPHSFNHVEFVCPLASSQSVAQASSTTARYGASCRPRSATSTSCTFCSTCRRWPASPRWRRRYALYKCVCLYFSNGSVAFISRMKLFIFSKNSVNDIVRVLSFDSTRSTSVFFTRHKYVVRHILRHTITSFISHPYHSPFLSPTAARFDDLCQDHIRAHRTHRVHAAADDARRRHANGTRGRAARTLRWVWNGSDGRHFVAFIIS